MPPLFHRIAHLSRLHWRWTLFIAAAAVFAVSFARGPAFQAKPIDAESLKAVSYWREQIELTGAEAAYEKFTAAMEDRPQTEQHTAAHVFGAAIWYEEGTGGLLVCDQRFSNGCAHQLVGLEILEKGPGAIERLREECPQGKFNRGVCLHSIGHGVLGYFGYTKEGLKRSIEECPGTLETSSNPIFINCYLGVFMEYNTQRLSTGGLRDTRNPTDDNLLASCGQFDGNAAWACVYVLPNWWRFLLIEKGQHDETSIFAQIRAQCESAVPERLLSACYAGAGYLLAFNLDTSPQDKARLCESATPGHEQALMCKKHLFTWLSVIYATLPDTPYRAETVCDGLNQAEQQECHIPVRLGVENERLVRI